MSCKRTARRPPKRRVLTIDSLAFGGDGVGRDAEGRVVFVPGTAPGDAVEVILIEEKKGFARAELERVRTPSPRRVEPFCHHFEAGCGGCQWQHVDLVTQRAAKEEIVRRALRHVCTAVDPILTPTAASRWRRRARLRWRRWKTVGDAGLGYMVRRSHELLALDMCPQLEEPLERALFELGALTRHLSGAGEIELLLGGREEVHIVLTGTGAVAMAPHAEPLLGRAGIVGVILRDRGDTVFLGQHAIDLADEATPFFCAADVFAQVTAEGNALLRRLVADRAGATRASRVLELYAGCGNFTRDLAAVGASVVAVEEAPAARDLGAQNLRVRGVLETVTQRFESAESAASAMVGQRFDILVLDPPRTGLSPGLAALLALLAPPRIVYVSCDPMTLARDLGELRHAYEVVRATPVDLMPQTYHVEVVVQLDRKATAGP